MHTNAESATQAGLEADGRLLLSFIIPTLNEQDMIPGLLENIANFTPPSVPYEVLVVDNGSQDSTIHLAATLGARVQCLPSASLGKLRNQGARQARGCVLTFLDADVRLTQSWSDHIESAIALLIAEPKQITGSWCKPAPNASWIARTWMDVDHRVRPISHIGTGHMILFNRTFRDLGGFDESLVTGEDFDICRRAEAAGVRIAPDPSLTVIHTRLPRTLREFFRRERWHGSGDTGSIKTMLKSSVVRVSLVFGGLHGVLLWSLTVRGSSDSWLVTSVSIALIVSLCLVGALKRGGFSLAQPWRLVQRSFLVYIFLWARLLSLLHFKRGSSRTRGW